MRFRRVQLMLANHWPSALACVPRWLGAMLLVLAASFPRAEESRGATRKFDLPADAADISLKRFREQSGRMIVWAPERVKGVTTNAVKGEWTPAEALEQMLAGTRLVATHDAKSGAFPVGYEAPPVPPRSAPSALKKAPPGAKPAPQTTWSESPVELGPFQVSTDRDVGYDAESSLAGTRLNEPLRNIASSVSVFTRQFLDDVAITDLSELVRYSVNLESHADVTDNLLGVQNGSRIVPGVYTRGQMNSLGLDYFASITPTDPYRVARYEDSRGPNSILFGIGKPGGLLNQTSKIANLKGDSRTIRYSLGSWGRHRLELDTNQVLCRDVLAVAIAALQQENGGWRAFDFQDKKRIYGAATIRPHRTLRFTVMGETGRDVTAVPPVSASYDAALAWYDNRQAFGVEAVTFAPNDALATAAQAALGVTTRNGSRSGGNHRVTFIENSGTIFDAIGTLLTGSYNNPAARAPDGSRGEATFLSRLNDPAIFPRNLNAFGPAAFRSQRLKNYTIFMDWEPSGGHLAFNLAHNYQASAATVYSQTMESPRLQGEANRTLGVDGPPNPWAGRLYFNNNWQRQVHGKDFRETRLSASYFLDTAPKWLGQHRLATLLSRSTLLDTSQVAELVLAGHPFETLPSGVNNRISIRNYITEGNYSTYRVGDWRSLPSAVTFQGRSYPVVFANNPVGVVNNAGGYQDLRSGLAVLHSQFAGGKLVTTIGYRHDRIGGVDLGYDADPIMGNIINRNRARGTSVPTTTARTGTTGVVYHVWAWLSLLANRSSNRGTRDLSVKVFPYEGPGLTHGRGEDYGFGFEFLDGRLNAKVVRFTLSSDTGTGSTPTSVEPAGLNTRVMDAFAGVLVGGNRPYSAAQWDSIYRTYTVGGQFVTNDFDATGYEAQVTANLTPQWRLVANYSYTNAGRTNWGGNYIAWYGLKTDSSGRVLSGVTQDASGRFMLDPGSFQTGGAVARWIELGAQAPAANPSVLTTASSQTVAQEVLSLVNSLNDEKERNEEQPSKQRPHKLSMFTAYDFKEGRLRGFTLGGGWRWRSANIIGTDSRGREVTGRVVTSADLMLAYQWKPGRVRFQINIFNLFNHTPILPVSYAMSDSAPDGFIVPGGRGIAYRRYDLTPPREIRCTTTYLF
jgi:hypothetical protein